MATDTEADAATDTEADATTTTDDSEGATAARAPRHRLSTGQAVSLPLDLAFATGGVVLPARRGRLETVLPDALSPLSAAPGVGLLALAGVRYDRVGDLEPYDEFGVVVPAVRGADATAPGLQLRGEGVEVGGFVHWLPVTTESGVALGRELWGYPKERADVSVIDGPDGVRAAVEVDGERVCKLEVGRAAGRDREWTLHGFTTMDGDLVRPRAELEGEIALRPGTATALEFGSGPRATELRGLAIGSRPIARFYASRARGRLFEGKAIEK